MVEDGLFDLFPCEARLRDAQLPDSSFRIFRPAPRSYDGRFRYLQHSDKGVGGHAAMPHLMRDPLLSASYMINMFQSIVSRNVNSLEAAVVSVTKLSAGTNYNIIPNHVTCWVQQGIPNRPSRT